MKNRGVTLLALAITIVVLLILAGITLSITIGGNGLIEKTKKTGQDFDLAQLKDEVAVAYTSYSTRLKSKSNLTLGYFLEEIPNAQIAAMDENSWMVTKGQSKVIVDSDGNIVDGNILTLAEAKDNSMLENEENSEMKVPGGTVTIPAGYKVTNDSGSTVDEGIVITDSATNGNEWVWVPVSDASDLYEESQTPIALTGSTGVTTTKYSSSTVYGNISRSLPGTTGAREPDVVLGSNGTSYDAKAVYHSAAGFTNLNNMTTTIVSEYNQMITSIGQYKGFWIGRYELSANGVKKNQPTLNESWYKLYLNCKSLSKDTDIAITRMIWGCQWDATCKFIASGENSKDITNSCSWGNYVEYNRLNGYIEGDEEYISEAGTKQVTGYSEYWKAKNIYDLAGNCWEETQEASGTNFRVARGGNCTSYSGSIMNPVTTTSIGAPYTTSGDAGTRPVLIILPSNNLDY